MSSFYKKYMIFIITILFLSLIGCGGGGGSNSSTLVTNTNESNPIIKATSLADANVTIYKVKDDGSLSLLWQEKTSSGDTLEEIGKFNIHTNELTDDDFYLYKITGGKDWDSDKNGILDKNFTKNKGIFRSIAQGVDIKKAGDDLKISYTTELFYEEVVPTLKRKFDRATFPSILNNKVSKIIEDSNNIQDILTFNPIQDKSKLKEFYKIRARKIVDDIHQGKIPALNMSAILGSYVLSRSRDNYSIALSNDDTKIYTNSENGFIIIDISNPTNPIKLGSFDTEASVYGITLSNDNTQAYLANANGLVIVDISNPSNPTKIGSYNTKGDATTVTISNDNKKVYVVDSIDGLLILDISDPTNPIKISSYNTGGYTKAVTLSNDGKKAYIIDSNNGLVIIDISNPSTPIKLSSYNTGDYTKDVALSNDETKVYLINGSILNIIDISDITNPIKLGSYHSKGEWSIQNITLSNDESKAYIAVPKGLIVIDISNPTNPTQLGLYSMKYFTYDVKISSDNTKAYVSTGQGLVILDISNLINPPKFDSYGGTADNNIIIPSTSHVETHTGILFNTIHNQSSILSSYNTVIKYIKDVVISSNGTKAYVIDGDGFSIIDISDITNPIKLNSYIVEEPETFQNIALSSDETKAYIIKQKQILKNNKIININSSLIVVDISNPKNLTELNSYIFWEGEEIGINFSSIALSKDDRKAYVIDGFNGLTIIDIANTANLTKIGSFNIQSALDIKLSSSGNRAYILTDRDLLVLDISNYSSNPNKINSYNVSHGTSNAFVLSSDGTKAYITDYDNCLIVVDISDSPIYQMKRDYLMAFDTEVLGDTKVVGRYNTEGCWATGITLSNDNTKAYITDANNGLMTIDISNPANPIKLATYSTEDFAFDVKLSNDETKAYVVDDRNGLLIIDLDLYN